MKQILPLPLIYSLYFVLNSLLSYSHINSQQSSIPPKNEVEVEKYNEKSIPVTPSERGPEECGQLYLK